MYNELNICMISLFSSLFFIPIDYVSQNNIRTLLLCYFVIDSYKNKLDIILHHLLYGYLTIYGPFHVLHHCLMMEWTTLSLLLYKEKYISKYVFAILWFGIRLIYIPYYFYSIYDEVNIYINNTTILIYGFHFHWTCKIFDRTLDTSRGFSSMLLMFIPFNILHYRHSMNIHNYLIIYLQYQISFYYNVIHIPYYYTKLYNIIRSMDNSMIYYISLRYCIDHLYSICFTKLFFLYKIFIDYDNKFHQYIFIFSTFYLIYHFVFLLPFAWIAFYVFHKKNNKDCHIIYNYLWHGCCGLLLAYSLIV
jgi:hypothetical protein